MADDVLPDYKHPPVTEITAAVQFRPLPFFGIREVVEVVRALDGWEVDDLPPAIPPMAEPPAGNAEQQSLNVGFGSPPLRIVLSSGEGRWAGQVQQDRLAIHERKLDERPSFRNVEPMLARFVKSVGEAVHRPLLVEPHRPDIVEVIYENRIASRDGGWSDFSELSRVLRGLQPDIGMGSYREVEGLTLAFSYVLTEDTEMVGRLRVIGEPQRDADGAPVFALRLVGRRFVQGKSVKDVLEMCHVDIVRGFTSITTEHMHEVWGRFQ
jgi:uncharacterized protein (TIGR04255 family)